MYCHVEEWNGNIYVAYSVELTTATVNYLTRHRIQEWNIKQQKWSLILDYPVDGSQGCANFEQRMTVFNGQLLSLSVGWCEGLQMYTGTHWENTNFTIPNVVPFSDGGLFANDQLGLLCAPLWIETGKCEP